MKSATHLTVLIRDITPLIHLNEPVSHRRVTIELTAEQQQQLKLEKVGHSLGNDIFEDYGTCLLETQSPTTKEKR